MKELVYQSPKSSRKRSGWVREDETRRRQTLEAAGWRVVETREAVEADAVPLAPVPDEEDQRAQGSDFDRLTADLTGEQREALVGAGFDSVEALREASDADLRDVPGIGPATVRNLRAALQP